MRRIAITVALALLPGLAAAEEDIVLRGMGSFHVGGRVVEITGKPVREHPRWATFKKIDPEYADAVRAGGGSVDVIHLPDLGLKGNSHMLMMDRNNGPIADVIHKWLTNKGLVD